MPTDPSASIAADVCLVLEGTYPYVAGGVSSWVHDLIKSLPERSFTLLHIGPEAGAYRGALYPLPANVTELAEVYCHGKAPDLDPRPRTSKKPSSGSRTLAALRRLHLEDSVDDQLLDDLAAADLSVDALLHGSEAFEVIREIARDRAPRAPFLEVFWHLRSMHVPLLRLLAAPTPRASMYHSVSTGYAGVVAAVASKRTGRPMLLTEHGIYARERDMELSRARWVSEGDADPRIPKLTQSPLRRLWSSFFMRMSKLAYDQAIQIVTLSEVNRRKQLDDGAKREKTTIVPNGVEVPSLPETTSILRIGPPLTPMRVGFVGRIVGIKDVLTLIRACDLALAQVPLEIDLIGPAEEEPAYAARCRELITTLGREEQIRFVGVKKPPELFRDLDVCVLTSFSEGQPLVILEAHAAGIPVIATDVGACREMLEGRDPEDRALGPGGIVTRVMAPEETAAALVRLSRNPDLRRRMGAAGHARVAASYAKSRMVSAYRTMYTNLGEVR